MLLIDKKKLNFEFKIESLDDLWILSEFIIQNDILFGTTERKVKIGGENSTKQIKKIIFVELKTKKASFENEVLRVSGEIQNETEFTTIGQSHTLNFKVGDKIKVSKINLLKFEEKLIDNAINSKKTKNLIILFDKDELVCSEFTEFSHRILFEKRNLGSKKGNNENIDELAEKFNLIKEYLKKDYSKIILAGPFSYKEKLKKYILDKINLKTLSISFPDINSTAIPKLIEKIQKAGILSDAQINLENEKISKLLENINKGEKYAYGEENSNLSINEGKCQILILTTKYIEKSKDENKYFELNKLIKLVEQLNGELAIINSKNEAGRIIDGLCGIATINRY